MLELLLDRVETVLFLGAHCDDIEIGCGGTILQLAQPLSRARVHWVVFSSTNERALEAHASARAFLPRETDLDIRIGTFRNGYFPADQVGIKDFFESLKDEIAPDLVFCHGRDDLHQDHRVINELCWNTFRNHLIMEYEVPKYDGDLGNPGVFVPLSADACRKKGQLLVKHFASQRNKQWFTESTFEALARLRGVQCASESGFAEAYHCRKLLLGMTR